MDVGDIGRWGNGTGPVLEVVGAQSFRFMLFGGGVRGGWNSATSLNG